MLKKLSCFVLALFLVTLSLDVKAQNNPEAVQEIAAAYDLAIYNNGTFPPSSTIAKLNAELQTIPPSDNRYTYYEAVRDAIQTQGNAPENALVYQVYIVGTENNLSESVVKVLYDEAVTMLQ